MGFKCGAVCDEDLARVSPRTDSSQCSPDMHNHFPLFPQLQPKQQPRRLSPPQVHGIIKGDRERHGKYERALLESFIEDNASVKWCPSVPNCGNAIKARD